MTHDQAIEQAAALYQWLAASRSKDARDRADEGGDFIAVWYQQTAAKASAIARALMRIEEAA